MGLNGSESLPRRRVLHVGKYYPPYDGGIENHVQSLCNGLLDHFDVTALVFNTVRRTVDEQVDGVRVVRAATLGRVLSTEMAPSFLPLYSRLSRTDLVHLHVPNPLGELACLAMRRRARLIVTYHSDVVRQRLAGSIQSLLLHRVLERADRIIVFTQRYMESSPVLRRHRAKCAIIPHGIDPDEMRFTPEAAQVEARLRQEHGDECILFVGRLVYYKGVDVLLRALAAVPGARLLLLGDGPMKARLEALASELGVSDRARFLGRVDHTTKVAACHAARFLVLPATHRSEAFGLVQVEAMAAGLPVVCTNIDSGVPFVNEHGRTGFVVEPNDPAALAEAMRRLLDDAPLRESFSAGARQRVDRFFTRRVMLREIVSLYQELLKDSLAMAS